MNLSSEAVYIIILNYNNFRCTDYCLASLRDIQNVSTKIVLVDNASSDDSYIRIMEKYPECIGIANTENGGFSRGCNIGLRYAYEEGGKYFMLLNNDVEVTPTFLTHMVSALQSIPDAGIITPKIYYRSNPKLIWHAGGHVNTRTVTAIAHGYDEIDVGQFEERKPTEWASGACCLFGRELLDKIGFLEELYFLGQEEWDYSTTAIRAGYKIIYEPKAIVYHEIGQTSWKSPALYAYQITYNKFVYARKFLSPMAFYLFTSKYLLYLYLHFPKKSLHTATNSSPFYLKTAKRAAFWGVRDFFRGIFITVQHLQFIDELLLSKSSKRN